MNAVYVYAIPASRLATSSKDDLDRIGWLAGEVLFGKDVSHVLSIILGSVCLPPLCAFFTAPRIAFMMARDGLMPNTFGYLHPTRHAPIPATLLVGGLSILMLWSGRFDEVLSFVSVGLTTLGGMTVASIFPLWWRREVSWPFRLPGFPIPPYFFSRDHFLDRDTGDGRSTRSRPRKPGSDRVGDPPLLNLSLDQDTHFASVRE